MNYLRPWKTTYTSPFDRQKTRESSVTGRLPFLAENQADLRKQILEGEPRPPRTIDDSIPERFERICLKALAKEPGDRYATAKDFGRELSIRRRPRLRALPATCVGLLALLALLALSAILWPREPATVRNVEFFVRQDGDDTKLQRWLIVSGGMVQPTDMIEPLGPNDDLKFTATLDKATWWYLLWIDTRGVVTVADYAEEPSKSVDYPVGAEYVMVSSSDPPGVHMLLLLTGSSSPNRVIPSLKSSLDGIDPPPPQERAVLARLRGPGDYRRSEQGATPSYLQALEERLPKGLAVAHTLSFETRMPKKVSRNQRRSIRQNGPFVPELASAETWGTSNQRGCHRQSPLITNEAQ
jgi:hypothetical protein